MARAREMLDTHPGDIGLPADELAAAIEACFECARTSTACADACLAEDDVASMRECIATDLNCADICTAVGRMLARRTAADELTTQRALEACIRACVASAAECDKHANHHRHCALCAESCRACADACTKLLDEEVARELEALRGA